MSLRVLKKLKNQQHAKAKVVSHNDGDESDEEELVVTPKNPFDLLNDEETQITDKHDSSQEEDKQPQTALKKDSKSKTKKNKKQKKKQESFNFVNELNDIDEYLNESLSKVDITPKDSRAKSVLAIESKYLIAENELKRMFGAKIVNAEKDKSKRGQKKPVLSKYVSIVSHKSNWPSYQKNGLTMRVLNECGQERIEFTFEHLSDYQKIQFEFKSAVKSLDHNNIINVLHLSPYHIDSLIQLSEVFKMSDDTNMAADFIERSLFSFQNSIHPSFSLQKQNYVLDYRRVENRGFFISLFKHINFVGGKACYRTSLELTKFLLSLDVEQDPLASILIVDFYALRSHQYKFLIDFYECFKEEKQLSLLPNMLFSVAIAYFYEERNEEANCMLKEALIKFPGILLRLLDKCGVQSDKIIENNWIFARHSHLSLPKGLDYLYNLYIARVYHEWKIPEVMLWLENALKELVTHENEVKHEIESYKSRFKSIFAKVPSNVLRHILLSDSKELSLSLPSGLSSTDTYTFDPIPPKDGIISYKLPERPQRAFAYANEESIFTFIRSLLPSFNSQDRVEDTQAEVAQEGSAGTMDRLRDLAQQLRDMFNVEEPRDDHNHENEFD